MSDQALSDDRLDCLGPAAANPDYKNLQYNADGSLSMEGEGDAVGSSFGDQIKLLGSNVSGGEASYENTRLVRQQEGGESDDYMNDSPEGLAHIYSNHEDLLLQVCRLRGGGRRVLSAVCMPVQLAQAKSTCMS